MRIGIIGAGNIGSVLARRLTALGHDVSVANSRGPETLTDLAAETGAKAALAEDVARGADVVVVTIPERSVPALPPGVLDGATAGAAIVDTGNYYSQRDGRIEQIEAGMTESRWVATELGRPVVKAFNTIRAGDLLELGVPPGTPGRIALPVAGDEERPKAVVMELVNELGFDPVDAGSLDESWRLQPGAPVYGANLDADRLRAGLRDATPGRHSDWSG